MAYFLHVRPIQLFVQLLRLQLCRGCKLCTVVMAGHVDRLTQIPPEKYCQLPASCEGAFAADRPGN